MWNWAGDTLLHMLQRVTCVGGWASGVVLGGLGGADEGGAMAAGAVKGSLGAERTAFVREEREERGVTAEEVGGSSSSSTRVLQHEQINYITYS